MIAGRDLKRGFVKVGKKTGKIVNMRIINCSKGAYGFVEKPCRKGDKVKVFNFSPSGKKFLEGIAVVDKKAEIGGWFYNICFESGYWCVRNLHNAEILKEKI